MVQLVITEGAMIYPVFYGRHPLGELLAPISLLVFAPMWALRDGAWGAFLAILSIDAAFLSIMTFSIIRNHKLVSAVCLFAFTFLGMGFIAAGY